MASTERSAAYPQSASEWDLQRATITRLYRDENRPLKEVQKIMEAQFHFKATKRMYNIRINKWDLNKHYKAKEKELLAAQITEAFLQNHKAPSLTFKGQPVKLHRIKRHYKDVSKRRDRGESRTTGSLSPFDNLDQNSSSTPSVGHTSSASSAAAMKNMLTPKTEYTPQSNSQTSPTISSKSDGDPEESAINRNNQPPTFGIESPASSMSFPPNQTNVEVILLNTQVYYRWFFEAPATERSGLETLTPPLLTQVDRMNAFAVDSETLNAAFWNKIKSAIYFLKVKSRSSCWPLLNEACDMAPKVITQHPLAFLRDVFATISPTNTTVCPGVRRLLLQFLATMMHIKLGPFHPFTIICHNLQMDAACRMTSEIALQGMIDIFNEYLGPSHPEVFQLKRSLITLLRRDRDLDKAEASATALMEVTETELGPDHRLTRMAMSELAHIYMDQTRYVEAAGICADILARASRGLGTGFPEDRSVYVMEDLAQICSHQQNVGQEIAWLQMALQGALAFFGKDAPTLHILEKLENSLTAEGRFAEAEIARQSFALP